MRELFEKDSYPSLTIRSLSIHAYFNRSFLFSKITPLKMLFLAFIRFDSRLRPTRIIVRRNTFSKTESETRKRRINVVQKWRINVRDVRDWLDVE